MQNWKIWVQFNCNWGGNGGGGGGHWSAYFSDPGWAMLALKGHYPPELSSNPNQIQLSVKYT